MSTTPGALTRFQDDFSRALQSDAADAPASMTGLIMQPAFAVYRNTVMKACIDALQANYPAVTRLVGEEWLRAAASIYVRENLPRLPMLIDYGADFAGFLARFEPAAELPYLPSVARLERFWSEAHTAASEKMLDPGALTRLAPENFIAARLRLHAATRWAWFADAPVYTIWSRNRSDSSDGSDIKWTAEGALLTRPHDSVQWCAIDQAGCAFLDACANGSTLAEAAQAALTANPETDLSHLMATLLEAGAFSRLHVPT